MLAEGSVRACGVGRKFLFFSAWMTLQVGFISQACSDPGKSGILPQKPQEKRGSAVLLKRFFTPPPRLHRELPARCFAESEHIPCGVFILLHHNILTQFDSSGNLCPSESQS